MEPHCTSVISPDAPFNGNFLLDTAGSAEAARLRTKDSEVLQRLRRSETSEFTGQSLNPGSALALPGRAVKVVNLDL